jgi:phenylacetate-CoA ligase
LVWNAIELVPWAQVERIQLVKLKNQLSYLLARSAFYREKLGADFEATQLGSLDDLAKLPFTEKDELRASLVDAGGLGRHGAATRDEVIQVQASSGTTGRPSYVGLTAEDLDVWNEMQARAFYSQGFRPGDYCLHTFSMSRGFIGGLPMVQALQYMDVKPLPIGAEAGVERLLMVAQDQAPRCVIGTPYFLIHMAEQAERVIGMPARDLAVEVVVVGGEPGGGIPVVRQRIEELWGARCHEQFGGTDAGMSYWAECEQGDGMHFCAQEFIIPEIVDPQSGARLPFETGVEGEIVYTTIDRRASPVLRFRSHDWVRVVGTTCACGRPAFKVRCTGRVDDMLIVRGINVFPSAIKDVVMSLRPRSTGEFRITADFEGHTTQRPLRVRLERGELASADTDGQLKDEAERALRDRLSAKFNVDIVDAGVFERPGARKVALIERASA